HPGSAAWLPSRWGRVKRQEKRVEEKKPEAPRPRPPRPAAAAAEARDQREVPADGTAPEELDQVVSMLGDMDIEVDTAVEETPLAEEPETAVEPEWTEEQPEPEEAPEPAAGQTGRGLPPAGEQAEAPGWRA